MMKKIAIFLLIIIGIVSTISYLYLNSINNQRIAQKENIKFEIYKDEEITGAEVTTLINKAINSNQQNEIEKDKKGRYIDNETNSINIDIKFIDDDVTYNIEKIYNNGMDKFLTYYRDIKFKCVDVQYHDKTQKIKYMLFEQITQ
ncbi:MAG: hypothetical protein UFI45_00180 [Clostridia bacterium]|jgi:uncharacterized membrane protein YhiD involved in acid resistance|nr:hypothetical protein [Clostridia bacterium]MED9923711.1 hypothetical protein [Clostridia bacterium]